MWDQYLIDLYDRGVELREEIEWGELGDEELAMAEEELSRIEGEIRNIEGGYDPH